MSLVKCTILSLISFSLIASCQSTVPASVTAPPQARTVIKEICREFAPVDIEVAARNLDYEKLADDAAAIQAFRDIEANESKRQACAKGG